MCCIYFLSLCFWFVLLLIHLCAKKRNFMLIFQIMQQIRSAIVNSVPISWRSKDFSESSNKFSDESFLNSNYNDNEDEMKQIDRFSSKPSMDTDMDMAMPPTLPQLFDFGSKDTENDNNGDNNNEDNENNNDVDEMDFDDEEDEDDEFDNK